MRPDLKGKKLLILAGSVHECDLVRRAKELGVYTIVTDYYDIETSPAKKIADEYWNISWSDIDALENRCRAEHIDGVTAGYSESTVENCIKLCERLGLPCYCSQFQMDILKDKKSFKKLCQKHCIPTVHEYSNTNDVDSFPVIIKPVDRGGSIGVSVANSKDELEAAYDYAMEMSYCKQVVIEDFITWGTKFDAYYVITNSKIAFLSSSDTINAKNNKFEKVIQSGWALPSRFEKQFTETIDEKIKNLIHDLGIQNGFIFFSGFSDGDRFVFFETGFRLSGGHMYRFFEANGMPDFQDVFIQHALIGNCNRIDFTHKSLTKKGLIINYYAKRGILTSLCGFEEIQKIPECGFVLPMCKIGTKCNQNHAILTKLGMIHLYCENVDKLKEDLCIVNALFEAKDENGNDIVYDWMSKNDIAYS